MFAEREIGKSVILEVATQLPGLISSPVGLIESLNHLHPNGIKRFMRRAEKTVHTAKGIEVIPEQSPTKRSSND